MTRTPVSLLMVTLLFTLACAAGQVVLATSTPSGEPTGAPASPQVTVATSTPAADPTSPPASLEPVLILFEAEKYGSLSSVGVRLDGKGELSNGEAVHIGGDDNVPDNETGWIEYILDVQSVRTLTAIVIRYADDIGGDAGVILVDDKEIASFTTEDTGTWNDYVTLNLLTTVTELQPGLHTLRLEVTDKGTYGLTVDFLRIGPQDR